MSLPQSSLFSAKFRSQTLPKKTSGLTVTNVQVRTLLFTSGLWRALARRRLALTSAKATKSSFQQAGANEFSFAQVSFDALQWLGLTKFITVWTSVQRFSFEFTAGRGRYTNSKL